jgi:hypothetical protein
MENPQSIKIGQWALENAVYEKIRAALEQILVGKGWDVFEGLQNGECNVKMVYHGSSVTFHKLERLEPTQLPLEEKLSPQINDTKIEPAVVLEVPAEPGPATEAEKMSETTQVTVETDEPLPPSETETEEKPTKRKRPLKGHGTGDSET